MGSYLNLLVRRDAGLRLLVGQNGAMTKPAGIITCLPEAAIDDLVGVVEVLIQERLTTFAASSGAVGKLREIFAARATIGSWAVSDTEQLTEALDQGAEFIFADRVAQDLVEKASAGERPIYLPAMTPTEVRAVLELGATGAVLWPADVVGHVLSGHLARLGLAERVIPMGGIGAYAANEWLAKGAPAAAVDSILLGDALDEGSLGALRERCAAFRGVGRRN